MSDSYSQILRSSTIIGGASVINILINLLRIKVVAVLLGPAGVGLIGILQSLMTTASTISAMGVESAGTRQIAEANTCGDAKALLNARRALFWGTMALAAVGAMCFWMLRDLLASKLLGDPNSSGTVGWLAIGVALTVAAGSQGALLSGLRRIGDIARMSVLATLFSTFIGVGAISIWGEGGVVGFVISGPAASFVLGHWFVSRLPKLEKARVRFYELQEQWKTLARLGSAFVLAGLFVAIGHLVVRAVIQRELGSNELGQFQAAWMISMTYIGFILQSMGKDYYPRLTAVKNDCAAVNRMANEQAEVALLLAGPLFLAMLSLAPWIIELLYTDQFGKAATLLRWQVLGDIFKVASWTLGIIILAAGDARSLILSETVSISVFVGFTWLGIPYFGIEAVGMAFLCMYIVHLTMVYLLAKRRTQFTWQRRVYLLLVSLLTLTIAVYVAGGWSKWLGASVGLIATAVMGLHSLARLGQMVSLGGLLGDLAGKSRQILMKMGLWYE